MKNHSFRKSNAGGRRGVAVKAERKGPRISFKIDSTPLPQIVVGDPRRLRQAVSNILSNSVEHPSHGVISIEIYPNKNIITYPAIDILNISIEDGGKGMSESQVNNHFRQFEDILDEDDHGNKDAKATESLPSIELGLAVVARYVRNYRGQMKIRIKEGVGTRVSLELPLRTATNTQSKDLLPTPSTDNAQNSSCMWPPRTKRRSCSSSRSGHALLLSPGAGSSTVITPFSTTCSNSSMEFDSYPFPPVSPTDKVQLRTLVAQDNPPNAKVLQMQLTKMGHEVTLTGGGLACLDQFKVGTISFDVVLMDFQVYSPRSPFVEVQPRAS